MESTDTKTKRRTKKRIRALGAGRPTLLTDEIKTHIRDLYLRGKTDDQICQEIGISRNTWNSWLYRDTEDLRKELTAWRYELIVKRAEQNLLDLQDSKNERIRLEASQFALETLNKARFSKKIETDTAQFVPVVLNITRLADPGTPLIAPISVLPGEVIETPANE